MQNKKQPLMLLKHDYDIMISCLRGFYGHHHFDRQNADELKNELRKARLVDLMDLPDDVVRLNSQVKIKEEQSNKITDLILVTPDKADIRNRKISVMAPLGTALIGFRKGQKIKWQVPSGKKTFTIIDVKNESA